MRDKKTRIMLAIGLLLVSGSFFLTDIKTDAAHFLNGLMKGMGLVFIIWAAFRMKHKAPSGQYLL